MTYCTRNDLVARFGESEIQQLEAGRPDIVAEVLADVASLIDSYLAARYPLPLPSVPPVLLRVSRDLVRYAVDGYPDEAVIRRRDDAIKYLEALSKGKATLGLAVEEEPESNDTAEMVSQPLLFSRENSKGFI
ncbi:hypothetical protein BFW38_06440 [Terasakiispira papahanaumokuakeensis]|uniref:DUF1320 domain-containing protein n=1 Tax=Terasakiispira papahanaumokuakeensis TaxID=197479 RepID=A0A1E2V8I4_9GAMM|nr:phage protein Gp36 family protein [Terasakiispira papahanaumokuakeensis]ODC03233.1 hypothetical protein BFW38_06440 [Terasakiispira papahanaumokuakeensis]